MAALNPTRSQGDKVDYVLMKLDELKKKIDEVNTEIRCLKTYGGALEKDVISVKAKQKGMEDQLKEVKKHQGREQLVAS